LVDSSVLFVFIDSPPVTYHWELNEYMFQNNFIGVERVHNYECRDVCMSIAVLHVQPVNIIDDFTTLGDAGQPPLQSFERIVKARVYCPFIVYGLGDAPILNDRPNCSWHLGSYAASSSDARTVCAHMRSTSVMVPGFANTVNRGSSSPTSAAFQM